MSHDRPNFWHDSPDVCVNKLFDMIQTCRVDASIMRKRYEKYEIGCDLIREAETLVRELKSMI